MASNKKHKAFSMIELMVSILVIAVIAGSFAPVISKKLANMSTIAGSKASLTRNCCGNTDCKLCYRGSAGCSCMDCRKECADNQYTSHVACECRDCNDTANGGIENCFSCHQDWFSGRLSCNQCMPGYRLDASGTTCVADTIETTHVGSTVWTARNAGDHGGPAFQWGDGTNNTVKRCVVGKDCTTNAGIPTCWVGATAASCTKHPTYSGCNRTVCNQAAANLICPQNGLTVPTVDQFKILRLDPNTDSKYIAPNTLFCSSISTNGEHAKCATNIGGCVGTPGDHKCVPWKLWASGTKEFALGEENGISILSYATSQADKALSVRCARDCSGYGDHCINCTSSGCSECNTGSYLTGTTCTACSASFGSACNECTNSGCTKCADGYFIKDGSCVACNDNVNGWGSTCDSCNNSGCTQCSGESYIEIDVNSPYKGMCRSCSDKWGSQCVACNASNCTQCSGSYYIETSGGDAGSCISCSAKWGNQCAVCNASSCTQCIGSYYIETSGGDAGKCISCSEKWGSQCVACNASSCTQCSGSYYIETSGGDAGKCLLCSSTWGSECVSCNASSCTQCDTGFHVENGVCVPDTNGSSMNGIMVTDEINGRRWTQRNPGDTGGPIIPPSVSLVATGTNCTADRCCWTGSTSSNWTEYGGYSGESRTVCTQEAAKTICAENSMTLPSATIYNTDIRSGSLLQNFAENIYLCGTGELPLNTNYARCDGTYNCTGAPDNACYPNAVWTSDDGCPGTYYWYEWPSGNGTGYDGDCGGNCNTKGRMFSLKNNSNLEDIPNRVDPITGIYGCYWSPNGYCQFNRDAYNWYGAVKRKTGSVRCVCGEGTSTPCSI